MSLTLHAVPEPTDARSEHALSRRDFRNLLCALHNVDGDEVPIDIAYVFIQNPVRVFLRADDHAARVIWHAMLAKVRP